MADRTTDRAANTIACEHDWIFVRDWMGDPSVPGGTMDCSHWECKKCSEERTHTPKGHHEDDGYEGC